MEVKKHTLYMRAYVARNREKMREYERQRHIRRMQDPEAHAKILEKVKLWKKNNKDKVSASYHRTKHSRKKKLQEYNRVYYLKNRDTCLAKRMAYNAKQRKTDPLYRLLGVCRARIRWAAKAFKKNHRTVELLGCSPNQLREHLESLWSPGMSWENYGVKGWHIDHKKPCCTFNLSQPDQIKACFHFTNLQPLWALDNLRKARKLFVA